MFLLLPTNVHIYKWVFPKFILGIYNAHAHAFQVGHRKRSVSGSQSTRCDKGLPYFKPECAQI